MSDIDADLLRCLFEAVGAHLEVHRETASVLVVGGAALALRGLVPRTTHDVDVLALQVDHRLVPPDFPTSLVEATTTVARDFGLDAGWFNAAVGAQWKSGLPPSAEQDIFWIGFRALRVGLASRRTLITLKLFAAVDQGPKSVHTQDLVALTPDDGELTTARSWVLTQDLAPEFPRLVDEVIQHVRHSR